MTKNYRWVEAELNKIPNQTPHFRFKCQPAIGKGVSLQGKKCYYIFNLYFCFILACFRASD